MSDTKKQFNKLKHDLECWREVILVLNSVLKWEKPFYPGIVSGIISVIYLILWLLDFSMLTMIAIGLLCLTLFDYFGPIVSKFIFKPENWTCTEERSFEVVCNEILEVKQCVGASMAYVFTQKHEKTPMYVIMTSIGFIAIAWLGSIIDNLLLCYLISMSVALLPGLQKYGVVQKAKGTLCATFGGLCQKIGTRASPKDEHED